MRILSVYRYYSPDVTPYARILRCIAERLVGDGHDVTVITAQPGYNDVRQAKQPWRETLGGVEIRRVRLLPERKRLRLLRTMNFGLFLARGYWHALFHHYDIILASSNPPVISGLLLRLIRATTGVKYVYHCQDLHPECSVLAGKLAAGPIQRVLSMLDAKTCSHSARTVVLCEDMVDALRDRGVDVSNVDIVNNFALNVSSVSFRGLPAPFDVDDGSVDRPSVGHEPRKEPMFRVLFAGNLGSFQGLDRLVAAAKILRDETDIQFVFMGAGDQRARLAAEADDMIGQTVRFLPFRPVEEAFGCMHRAELGVVSLIPGIYRVAYPSKTMMYLAAGCPVLGILEPQSDLAYQLQSRRLGWVPHKTTPEAIATVILRARADWATNGIDRERLRRGGEQLYGRKTILDRWSRMFDGLDADRRALSCQSTIDAGKAESDRAVTDGKVVRRRPATQPQRRAG